MNRLPNVLAAARALLQLNVKDVATAMKMSDKTITTLEKDADSVDPKVVRLVQFYEDLGVEFSRDADGPTGVSLASGQVRKLTLTFAGAPQPSAELSKLAHMFRNISGMVYKLTSRDKSKASLADTIEIHFPIETRNLVADMLRALIEREGPFQMVVAKDQLEELNVKNVRHVVTGQ